MRIVVIGFKDNIFIVYCNVRSFVWVNSNFNSINIIIIFNNNNIEDLGGVVFIKYLIVFYNIES